MDAMNLRKNNVQGRRPNMWVAEDEPEYASQFVMDRGWRTATILSPPGVQLSDLTTRGIADVNAKEYCHSSLCSSRKS